MKKNFYFLGILLVVLIQHNGISQNVVSTEMGQTITIDLSEMQKSLGGAPMETNDKAALFAQINLPTIKLPVPGGRFEDFKIVESPVVEQSLGNSAFLPKTYYGISTTRKEVSVRFSIGSSGLNGIVKVPLGYYIIEPIKNQPGQYKFYNINESPTFDCKEGGAAAFGQNPRNGRLLSANPFNNGSQLRTFKLAAAATGEFTTGYGGTAGAIAQIQNIINATNLIYESEVAVRFTLTAATTGGGIIFSDATTDPFTPNPNFGSANDSQNSFNTMNTSGTLPYASYDVGHTFNVITDGYVRGTAGPYPCINTTKARGWTEMITSAVLGAVVNVFVHEVGHQFEAWHTYNAIGGNPPNLPTICTDGWSSTSAIEPGSGSTLMGYNGNCSFPNNYVLTSPNSENYFHTKSLESIITSYGFKTVGTPGCGTLTPTNNAPPVASAGADFTIPKGTAFTLTGAAGDLNNDVLTYAWEQYDVATANDQGAFGSGVVGTGGYVAVNSAASAPLFRSRLQTTPVRTFPAWNHILADASNPATSTNPADNAGEDLPQVARTMKFRFTVRDNRAGGGGVDSDETILTVDGSGPFLVTSQNAAPPALVANGSNTFAVTWSVNGTNAAPINCANVKILFSTDGGSTFAHVLANSTPNDGNQTLTVPNLATTSGRIKIEAVGNIFFDINNANFTITTACGAVSSVVAPAATVTANAGSAALNLNLTPNYGSNINSPIAGAISGTATSLFSTKLNTGGCFGGFGPHRFQTITFTVPTAGVYTFSGSNAFTLYTSPYTPSNFCGNWLASNITATSMGGSSYSFSMGSVGVNLNTGISYTLVVWEYTFAGSNLNYDISYSGPDVLFAPATQPTGFSYNYVAVDAETGLIKAIGTTANLSSAGTFPAGTYNVYGLLATTGLNLSGFVSGSLLALQNNFLNTPACGKFSDNIITVNVTCPSAPAAPTVTSPLSYCTNVIAPALAASGTNLEWYTVPTGGVASTTAPVPATNMAGNTNYYVSQTVGGCESSRATIAVSVITNNTTAPTATSPVVYCQNATATALVASGTALRWYTTASGGTASTTAPTPVTAVVGVPSATFYVTQTTGGCEGPRTAIAVNINPTPAAPTVVSPVNYNQNATATPLTASGSNLKCYVGASGGTASTTAPTPSTATLGNPASVHYVSQTAGICESPRAVINVVVRNCVTQPTYTAAIPTGSIQATTWISAKTNATNVASAQTVLDAKTFILFEPNVTITAATSGYFLAKIGGCP